MKTNNIWSLLNLLISIGSLTILHKSVKAKDKSQGELINCPLHLHLFHINSKFWCKNKDMKEEPWSSSPMPDYYKHSHYVRRFALFSRLITVLVCLLVPTAPPEIQFQNLPFLWSDIF